jgi:hypothetical protein
VNIDGETIDEETKRKIIDLRNQHKNKIREIVEVAQIVGILLN